MEKVKKAALVLFAGLLIVSIAMPVSAAKGKININTAGPTELVQLKHVGEKLAQKIIEYRKAHPFKSPEEIMQVKGIGQKVFESNKDIIVVQDE